MKKSIFIMLLTISFSLILPGCRDHESLSIEYVKKGKKKLALRRNSEALELFNEAIHHNDKNFEAWYFRGNCRVSLGQYHEGIRDLDKSMELKPDFAAAWYNRGLAWFYLDNREKACADWIRAEELGYPNIGDRTRHCR